MMMIDLNKNGWPYEFGLTQIDELFIDYNYQRPVRPKFVAEAARNFRPELVFALLGNRRSEGRIAVVDGGQRWHICKEAGVEMVPVMVLDGLSYEEEADIFVAFNFARGQVSPFVRYSAMVEAKIPMILALQDVVESAGFKVAQTASGDNAIASVGTLEDIFMLAAPLAEASTSALRTAAANNWIPTSVAGPELLGRTLESLSQGFRERETWHAAKTGAMIRGVARFLSAHPDVTAEEMGLVLKHKDPIIIQGEARAYQGPGSGSGKGRPVELVIRKMYAQHGNKSLLLKEAS